MARGLTERQRTVLDVVERFWRERGHAPSVADVAAALDVGRSTAYQHLVALTKKGFVEHEEGTGRSWKPCGREPEGDRGPGVRKVPVLPRPPHARRAALSTDVSEWITVDGAEDDLFALRVTALQTSRAAEIGIGDLAIVARGARIATGDIVLVAKPKGAATFARATGRDGQRLLGKVIEVRRNLRGKEPS